jgi:molybdopterin-guanine dinucleotide biosynthesis protein B
MKVLGIAGYSGSGKTTLIEKLLPRFRARGLRVAVLKHAHCGFDLDTPGKDSWRHRAAGASEVLVVSERRWALMHENESAGMPALGELLAKLSNVDLVLVEGWRQEAIAKIEVHRVSTGSAWLYPHDPHVIALACDHPPQPAPGLPCFGLDDDAALFAHLCLTLERLPC